MLQNLHVLLTSGRVENHLRLPHKTTPQRPKVVRTPGAFNVLTSKCASRHNGVHFFDISTSKSGPDLVCFVHFHFEMSFAPQCRALFRHLNFQKCSEWCVLYILTSKCASCHNGVHFFDISTSNFVHLTSKRASRHNGVHFCNISTSKSAPNVRCFVHFDFEMCFPQRRALFHLSSGQMAPHPLL